MQTCRINLVLVPFPRFADVTIDGMACKMPNETIIEHDDSFSNVVNDILSNRCFCGCICMHAHS